MHSVFAVTQSSTHSSDANSFGHSSFFAPNATIIHNDNVKTLILFQELNFNLEYKCKRNLQRENFSYANFPYVENECLLS